MPKEKQASTAGGAPGAAGEGSEKADPRRLALQRRIRAAKVYNDINQELCSRFDQLTSGVAAQGIRAIMAWQRAHGLKADGKVGEATIQAAQAADPADAGKRTPTRVTFSDDEADSVRAEDAGAADTDTAAAENPSFDDHILGNHPGLPHATEHPVGDALEKGGEAVEQTGQLAAMTGLGEPAEGLMKLAQAPAILDKLREGHYVEAFTDVAKGVDPKEAAEVLASVCEKLGLGRLSHVFETFASYGTELNVLVGLVGWTWEGFKQIHEAHERGDRENRIDLYADAYAHAFLSGEGGQAGLRAATPEEHEAVERGRKEGQAAAASTGPLATVVAKELLRRHGTPEGAARYIKSYLLKEAGLASQAQARTGTP